MLTSDTDELSCYVEALDKLNVEARLIGLLIMHTGCRTMEAAGLTHDDLQMKNNTLHLQLRPRKFSPVEINACKR